MRDCSQALAAWVEEGGGEVGEIVIRRAGAVFLLCHRDEITREALAHFEGAESARALAMFDDAGRYRPLKTAPNLRHGWELAIAEIAGLRRALDYFYPAMLGVWLSHRRGELMPVSLRETLARQSGMYRVTQKISDAQADTMIADFCKSDGGCLKHILWQIAPGQPISMLPPEKLRAPRHARALPLLCHEACNLLVGKAREVVKRADLPR